MMDENMQPISENAEAQDDRFSAFAQPVYQEKSPQKRGKMKKRTLTLVLSSAGALVLAGAVLLMTLLPSATPGSSSGSTGENSHTDTSVTLLDKTSTDTNVIPVKSVTVTFEGKSYTILYNADKRLYQLKGYEDLALEPDGVTALTNCLAKIVATEKMENATALTDVGLDKPTAKATVTYHDGSTATVLVGSKTPSEGSYYMMLQNSDGIYIIAEDAVNPLMTGAESYVETTLITAPEVKKDDGNGSPALRDVTLSGRSHPTPLTISRRVIADGDEMQYYTYIISAPYKRGVADAASNALTSFYSLEASQAFILHPTAAQKKQYGFDNPLTVMKMTICVITSPSNETSSAETATEMDVEFYNTIKTTVTIGDKDENGNYLVMIDGVDAIFLVAGGSLSAVAERTYDNTVTNLLFLKDITEVGRIDVTLAGTKHRLDLTHFEEKEDRDESLLVKEGDKTYNTSSFRSLYQLMMGLYRYDGLKQSPTGTSELSIAIYDVDGSLYLAADFFPTGGGSLYHVRTTEGELFITKASDITFFVNQFNNLLNGKDVLVRTE